MNQIPQITRVNGQPRLLVDGKPFLILGLQWDCDSCFSPEEMNPLFPHAARMGANTAALPTYWRQVEPEPGKFDFTMIDERIKQARANGMRLVLLWFATWKNACTFYAPDYIKADTDTYRLAVDPDGQPTVSLCPTCDNTWQRDRDALAALMTHLREVDDEHTVILVQLENEHGILGSDRCYCSTCNEQFTTGDWAEKFGVDAAEAFSTVSMARYIGRLAEEAKAIYPIPLYVNVWLAPEVGGIPGTYPSGGAVPEMLDLFRQHLQHIDMVSPDIYMTGYRDFHRFCQIYGADDNPLYIAEHSSSPVGRAERNVYYAIGQHGAIGFDPWAIDSPFPERHVAPLVDAVSGQWGPQAYWLQDSYEAIARAMQPITEAQGSERLFTFVQESAAEGSTGWAAEKCDILISYEHLENAARGMIIQLASNEFLLLGVGFSVRFRRSRPDGRPIPIVSADWGRYEDDHWILLHPMRRERLESVGHPVQFLEPGVARIVLDLG